MNKFLFFLITLFCISCNQIQYGEKNEIGYNYYFNSISGENSNIGTKDNPLKTLDFLDNINLEEGAHSSQDEVSHFSLSDKDDEIILNDNNSYLHDNVD